MSIPTPGPPNVVYELYPLDTRDPAADPYGACLLAWADTNRLPVPHVLATRRITVNMSTRTIEYWLIRQAPTTPGAFVLQAGSHTNRLEQLPLLAEPAGILIREHTCGHTTRRGGDIRRCTIETDTRGRHPGDHTDRADDAAIWLNTNPGLLPYRGGRVYVAGRTPTEQHAMVLLALEERAALVPTGRADVWDADRDGYAGRRRVLDRHQPAGAGPLCDRRCSTWPCPDYRDAAAGLVTGLETY